MYLIELCKKKFYEYVTFISICTINVEHFIPHFKNVRAFLKIKFGFADRHPTPITSNQIPGAATTTLTGKHPRVICARLLSYLNAQFLLEGFKFQFIVHYEINKELRLNRIAGPFTQPPLQIFRYYHYLLPKKDGNITLIQNLSYPLIILLISYLLQPPACSVKYSSIDEAAYMIVKLIMSSLSPPFTYYLCLQLMLSFCVLS